MKAHAIYGGSFDPIHLGHVDIIRRGAELFGTVLVAVGCNPRKQYLFDLETRLGLVRSEVGNVPGVSVDTFDGLLVEKARAAGCRVTLRGLRAQSDFAYEYQMAVANAGLAPGLETVCLLAAPGHAFISSTLVREIGRFGGDVSPYVSPEVARRLAERAPS